MNKKLLLLLFCLNAFLFSVTAAETYFDTILTCSKKDRIRLASEVNYKILIHLDTVQTVIALDQLKQIAREKDDTELEIFETLLRGEFYYRTDNDKCISFFQSGLKSAEKYEYKNLIAQALHNLGLQYYKDNQYNLAFDYLLKSSYLMKDYGYSNYPDVSKFLYELGKVYCQFGDYEKSKKFLDDAVKYPYPNATYGIWIYNTLGICNRELGNLEAAKESFLKTIKLATASQESVWVGIGTGNLGSIYHKLKKYREAIPLYKIDYEISFQNKEYLSASSALCLLADIYMNLNNPDSAGYFLHKATDLLHNVKDPLNYRIYYIRMADFYKLKKDYVMAFKYLDSANYYNNILIKRDYANIKAKAEQKATVEKYLTEMQLLETKKEIQVITRNAVITGLILLLIITILFLNKLRLRRENERQSLQSAIDQLNLYLDSIKEKNKLINEFEEKLQNIDLQNKHDETIAQLQNYTILTEDDWNEFRRLFEKVHADFFVKLKHKYPTLTQSEVRLMALIKLNLAKKEMADMLGISPDSVKKTRQRIKKKIFLPENADLEEIAYSI